MSSVRKGSKKVSGDQWIGIVSYPLKAKGNNSLNKGSDLQHLLPEIDNLKWLPWALHAVE